MAALENIHSADTLIGMSVLSRVTGNKLVDKLLGRGLFIPASLGRAL